MQSGDNGVNATRILGGVGTGKTQRLVEETVALLGEGARSDDVIVVCASPVAAQTFCKRLARAGSEAGVDARGVCVTTARELALEVLGDEEAVEWSGREPRILCDYEELFLSEDMKVSGLRPKRLHEMLKFFYRSWTELADDDPDWLVTEQEEQIHGMVKSDLALMESVLEPEAGNLAVNFLRTHEEARADHLRAHVLVDDYQRLNRASQLLCRLLAGRSITITGDRAACVETYDSYPYAKGLDEFLDAYPRADELELTGCRRCSASRIAAKTILADESMPDVTLEAAKDAPEAAVEVRSHANPSVELEDVARLVKNAIGAGTPEDAIAVAAPDAAWSRNIVRALRSVGVKAEALPARQPVRGDVRDLERCVPARILTALELVADPDNPLAWRCWCGYGDYLTNSAVFAKLRGYVEERGVPLSKELKNLAEDRISVGEHVKGTKQVIANWRKGQELVASVGDLEGRKLLEAIAHAVAGEDADVPPVVAALCLEEGGDESAQAMAARARFNLLSPTMKTPGAVAVTLYDQAFSLSPDVLVIAGFVNGTIPCHDYFDGAVMPKDKQEKTHARDCQRVYSLAGSAGMRLVVSYYTSVGLEAAGHMDVKIDRIALVDGKKTCTVSPSEFLAAIEGKKG